MKPRAFGLMLFAICMVVSSAYGVGSKSAIETTVIDDVGNHFAIHCPTDLEVTTNDFDFALTPVELFMQKHNRPHAAVKNCKDFGVFALPLHKRARDSVS